MADYKEKERKKQKQINTTRETSYPKNARQFHITGKHGIVQHANSIMKSLKVYFPSIL